MRTWLFSLLALFLIFPLQVFADSCNTPAPKRPAYNQNLEAFLQEQNTNFFKKYQETLSQTKDCSRKDQFANTWKDLQRNTAFGISHFIFSFSSFYNNSCRQKDVEKLLMQVDAFENGILETIGACKDPTELINLSQKSNAMLQFIRDHSDDAALASYWDKELYAAKSAMCPTESWHEVERAWCELKNNVSQFKASGEKTTLEMGQEKLVQEQIKQSRIAKAKEEALKYIQYNLPSFLKIASSESNSSKNGAFSNALFAIFAPIVNSIQNFLQTDQQMSLQETQTIPAERTRDGIKLFNVQALLTEVSDSYGKSYQTQIGLEQEIHAIRKSVERMTQESSSDRTFRTFLETLKKAENIAPRKCTININNP